MPCWSHKAFAPIAPLTVGGFRDWLLSDEVTSPVLAALAPGVTPEMAAADNWSAPDSPE